MYCKYCGKEVAEDSSYCTFCGKKISDEEDANTSTKVGLKERFTCLPKWHQIAIIIYLIWLFGWVGILIKNLDSWEYGDFYEQNVLPFFLYTILGPFVIVSSIYIYKLLKSNNNHTS